MANENAAGASNQQAQRDQGKQGARSGEQEQKQQSSSQQRQRGSQPSSGGLSRRESYAPTLFGQGLLGGSPFTLMRRMMEDLDRMFADFGGRGLLGEGGRDLLAGGEMTWMPQVDVFERDGNLVVRADVPGIPKENLRVEITDDALVLSGERRQEVEEDRRGVYRSERSYGSFRRVIPLPEGATTENASAHFDNGVLEINIPTTQEQSRARRIEIQESKGSPSMH